MTTTDLELFGGDPTDLDDLLDRAARDLHRNMQDGYIPGYEQILADHFLDRYCEKGAEGQQALDWLIWTEASDLIYVNCLLDEAEDSSYDAVSVVANTLLEAIRAQGRERDVLKRLLVDQIVIRSQMEHITTPGWI